MIRIIAGSRKNRRVLSLPMEHHVKPISVRMRKSLFDIIRPHVTASIFLDLYAGIGLVGLEALSRGAEKVVFVDNDNQCIKTIKRNLKHLNFEEKAVVVKADVLKDLSFLKIYSSDGYDIIFIAPPYRDKDNNPLYYCSKTVENILKANLLSEYGIIITQHHVKEFFEIGDLLIKYRSEKYGDTIIDFIKQKNV
ncbi:MAG: 16S rRNA (guanine(966)-N(2))-methyltransferase RsmD [Elusimicrobiales bacterium]|nr:16S rRNA (guanine(966)-N(2))-methyltransferase RsmD [Elusimicrobiales bacterium]